MHVIVFSPKLTPRIKYIFNFIFKDILKTDVEFTGNTEYFLQNDNLKISYADKPVGKELFFKHSNILLSNKVEELKLKTTTFDDYKVPFSVDDSTLPFDVFAASFFIISRYEEYLHKDKSVLNFKAEDSYQHKWKILNRPIIDEWAMLIKNVIRKNYPSFKFSEKKFKHQPTINFTLKPDVPPGFFPKSKFIFSSIFNKEQKFLSSVFDELTGLSVNPAEVLESFPDTQTPQKPIYFVNFPLDSKNIFTFRNSKHLLENKNIGLFRPCATGKEKLASLKADLLQLKKLQQGLVNLSSQQIDDLKLPSCYLNLISAGITADYSMGYEDTPGFRAGTCTPFNWYDLQLEKVTPLLVYSYCLSDEHFTHLDTQEAKKLVTGFIDVVKLVHGYFISNWQLRSLSQHLKYKKLKATYNDMNTYA